MMDDDLPKHLRNRTPSDEEYWKSLHLELVEAIHNLSIVRFQTKDQAVGKKNENGDWEAAPTIWWDESIGQHEPAWFEGSYIGPKTAKSLEKLRTAALTMIPFLQSCVEARALSPEFVWKWGRLSRCSEIIDTLADIETTNISAIRSGLAGGEAVSVDEQRQWFAHYFIPDYKRGKRAETEDKIESLVNNIASGKQEVPEGTDLEFFDAMLQRAENNTDSRYPRPLTNTYRDTNLTVKKMKELYTLSSKHLPLLKPKIPLP